MNIQETINHVHSKACTLLITDYIGDDQERFDTLIRLFLKGTVQEQQRAAWVLRHCHNNHPSLIQPYLKQFVELLGKPVHDAVLRNVVYILQIEDLPEDLQGIAFEHCYGFLADPNRAVAIRIFSMTVLFKIAKEEADLLSEIRMLIEEQYEHGSSGFKSRGRTILKKIKKQLKVLAT